MAKAAAKYTECLTNGKEEEMDSQNKHEIMNVNQNISNNKTEENN